MAAGTFNGAGVEVTGLEGLKVPLPDGADPAAFVAGVNARLVEQGFSVFRLGLPSLTLEEIYLKATGDAA
jgi:hypothetical protein